MEVSTNAIYSVINNLLVQKSKRDGIKFTSAQLAQAINVKRSIVQRLLHPEPSKRVTNPRIETLLKIVNFFRIDGFDIRIDDLLMEHYGVIDVQEQVPGVLSTSATIPLYSLSNPNKDQLGSIDLKMIDHKNPVIALLSEEDIKPIFKKGSIFIIDPALSPENNVLLAVSISDLPQALIRKYYVDPETNIPYLKSYNPAEEIIKLTRQVPFKILGVVIQVNAAT